MGRILWQGQVVTLQKHDHDILVALLERAGQIVPYSTLMARSGATKDSVDQCVRSLTTMLREVGVTCLSCRVEGIGYLLWSSAR